MKERTNQTEIDAEGYLAGQRRWKVDPKVPLGDKIQRSFTREAKLFKAQARIQSEVDKLLVVIDLAKEQIGDRHTRIKEVFASVEAERADRAGWQKEYEDQEYPESSSASDSEGDRDWHGEQGEGYDEDMWTGREQGHKRMRRQGDEGGSSRRGRAARKEDHFGVPRALKVILGALKDPGHLNQGLGHPEPGFRNLPPPACWVHLFGAMMLTLCFELC